MSHDQDWCSPGCFWDPNLIAVKLTNMETCCHNCL